MHNDQRGSLSIASVFALMMLVMLLGLVVNVGRQVDRKVKAQNAADASAYSAGIILARNMNALAFTNHLLCDVFALTTVLREVQETDPPVSASRQIWLRSLARSLLPTLEIILAEEQIARSQRELISTTPLLATTAADGIAREHGTVWPRQLELRGMLWSAAGPENGASRLLPVVDPSGQVTVSDETLLLSAQRQRRSYAETYLRSWNREFLGNRYNSRAGQQWQRRTQRRLASILQGQPLWNLPALLRPSDGMPENLRRNFSYVGVVYGARPTIGLPGLFTAATPTTHQAYAEVRLFIPRNRLFRDDTRWPYIWRQARWVNPGSWDLWNQNWTVQLTPATTPALPWILSATPPLPGNVPDVSPTWQQIDPDYIRWLSHH